MKYIEKHPMIMIVVGILGVSVSAILVRLSQAPSAVTAAWRLLWTVALMTPVTLGRAATRQELARLPVRTVLLSILSGLFLAAHFISWFESLKHTTVASSTTIVCTEVVWVSLGYCLFLKGRLTFKAMLAIGITVLGSVVIALADSSAGGSHLYGDLLALVAAVVVAAYTLLGRTVQKTASTTVYTYLCYSGCGAALLAVCLASGTGLLAYGSNPVVVGLLLAIFCTILGHSVFSWCLKYFSPSFVSASKLCEPVAAAAIALFLFGEVPVPTQILGGAMILGGVLFYSRIESKNEKSAC